MPDGKANHDMGQFGAVLKRKGFRTLTLDLTTSATIPDNSALLVIASPAVNLLKREVRRIEQYIDRGGNLLWLQEPDAPDGMTPIAHKLGIQFLAGVVVDATSRSFGIDNPAFAVINHYPSHPITANFNEITLFPLATALAVTSTQFSTTGLLTTLPYSWTETGPLDGGTIQFDADHGEHDGALMLGAVLTREIESNNTGQQRVIVIGDGDFLSNRYIGNGGNLNFGVNLIEWLSHQDDTINIPVIRAPDRTLELSRTAMVIISFGFLFIIPLLLLGAGWLIRYRRRQH
jgi:ABC-type uncharacterized transport system involved in gliding motility auxiliary subunit